jgi:hypothetical protein
MEREYLHAIDGRPPLDDVRDGLDVVVRVRRRRDLRSWPVDAVTRSVGDDERTTTTMSRRVDTASWAALKRDLRRRTQARNAERDRRTFDPRAARTGSED